MKQEAEKFRLEKVIVFTDDDDFRVKAEDELSGIQTSIHSYQKIAATETTSKNTLYIIDARKLELNARHQLYRIGRAEERIVIGDSRYDNLLGKTHVPYSSHLGNTANDLKERLANAHSWHNPN